MVYTTDNSFISTCDLKQVKSLKRNIPDNHLHLHLLLTPTLNIYS